MKRLLLLIKLGFLVCFSAGLMAQSLEEKYEVVDLCFKGNKELSDGKLLNVVRTRETPWVVWKWIYSLFGKEILGGQKPEYFDPVVFASDYYNIKRFYEDNGFFQAKIDSIILLDKSKREVRLEFKIVEGKRSFIDTINIYGIEALPEDVAKNLFKDRIINVGDPFIQENVEQELKRLISVFANSGYIDVKVKTADAQYYASTNNFSIIFVFEPGERYTFGEIKIQQDTAYPQISPKVVLRHIDFKVGEYYSEEKKIASERNLNRLGIFEVARIESDISNMQTYTQIPIRMILRTRDFQELTPEIGINDENNAFNVLFGVGYNHRNIFGGAEFFSTHIRTNLHSLKFSKLFKSNMLKDSSFVSKTELSMQFVLPYFINNKTNLSIALTAMLDKQPLYYLPSLGFRLGTQSQTATYTKLFIDWNLQISDPKSLNGETSTIVYRGARGTFEKQFNSFVAITLQRDKRNDFFYPSEGIFQSVTIEEGGIFPRVFKGLLKLELPYSQYVKVALSGQWYWDPGKKRDLIWALRLRAGSAILYGNSPLKNIPLTQRFYSGGSGSVRGWKARELGAMSSVIRGEGGRALVEGNLESRWNFLKGAGSLWFIDLEKLSMVFFYDCGTIWLDPKDIRASDIGMAIGFGLRYNTVAGPVRIDFGMKLYDPDAQAGNRWITQRRFFPETFKGGVIHLGVGHTF